MIMVLDCENGNANDAPTSSKTTNSIILRSVRRKVSNELQRTAIFDLTKQPGIILANLYCNEACFS